GSEYPSSKGTDLMYREPGELAVEPILAAARAGAFELPEAVTEAAAIREHIAGAIAANRAEREQLDQAGAERAAVAAILAGAGRDKIPADFAAGVARTREKGALLDERARLLRDAHEQARGRVVTTVADLAEEIVVDWLRPALAEILA